MILFRFNTSSIFSERTVGDPFDGPWELLMIFDSRFILGVPNFPLAVLEKALDEVCAQLRVALNPVLFEDRLFGVDLGTLGGPNEPLEVTVDEGGDAFFDGAEKGLEVD